MSRVGKNPILVPKGVDVVVSPGEIKIKGPKGELIQKLHASVAIEKVGESLQVSNVGHPKFDSKYHGLTRALVSNMVKGVSVGFQRNLSLIGVGYRAQQQAQSVQLTLGYSHPIVFDPPKGVSVKVDKQTSLIIEGADKQLVGQVAAKIRSFRPPEPYHGKGVRYADEVIISKVGKSGSK